MALAELNEDFLDPFRALLDASAEFVIVGAHALAAHGHPRATGDLDILVSPRSREQARNRKPQDLVDAAKLESA